MCNLLIGNAGFASQERGPRSAATAMVAGERMNDSIVNIGGDERAEGGDPGSQRRGGCSGEDRLAKRQREGTSCNSERGENVVHQQAHAFGTERLSSAVEHGDVQGDVQGEDTRLESTVWGRRLHEFLAQESVAALEAFERQLLVEAEAAGAGAAVGTALQGGASSGHYRGAEGGGKGLLRMHLPLQIAGSMRSAQVPSSRGAARNEGPGLAAADGSSDRRSEFRRRASKRKTRASGAKGHALRQGTSMDAAAPPEILFRIGWASSLQPMIPGTSLSFVIPCLLMSFLRPEQRCTQAFRTRLCRRLMVS